MNKMGACVALIAAAAVAACGSAATEQEATETQASRPPMVYGDDPMLDRWYDQCAEGDMVACEDLVYAPAVPENSEYRQYGAEQLAWLLEANAQTEESEPEPVTAAVPAGYEDLFPVTVEYEVDGWTYAQTFYGGPDGSVKKVIENSPPGEAQLSFTSNGVSVEVSGEVSLDEGRNAPESGDEAYWALYYHHPAGESSFDDPNTSAYERDVPTPGGCVYRIFAEPQGWICEEDDSGDAKDWPEADVDQAFPDFQETDSIVVGVTGPGACLIEVRRDGTLNVLSDTWSSRPKPTCVDFYQGELAR